MKFPQFTTRDELNSWLTEIGQDPYDQSLATNALAETIRDIKTGEAHDINEAGIPSQVDFLLTTTDVDGVRQLLRDLLGFDAKTGYLLHQEYGFADIPDGWTPVQRDDEDGRFEGDGDAAEAAARDKGGVAVAFFRADPTGEEDPPGDYAIEWIDPNGNFDPNKTNPEGLAR